MNKYLVLKKKQNIGTFSHMTNRNNKPHFKKDAAQQEAIAIKLKLLTLLK
jgi:hypothetical protein